MVDQAQTSTASTRPGSKPSTSEIKAANTTRVAQEIRDFETAERERKTARLRALRLKQEAAEERAGAMMEADKPARRRSKAAAG